MFSPILRICLAAFCADAASMSSFIALPFFIFNQLDGGPGMSGGIQAGQALAYAGLCLVSSPFVSKLRNGLSWAQLGVLWFPAMFCAMLLSRDPWICGAFAILSTPGMALVWPAVHSWVGAEPEPDLRRRHMRWLNISWSLGFAVAPLLAGYAYDMDYRLPFALTAAFGFAAFLLLRSLPHEKDHFGVASEELLETRSRHDRLSRIYLFAGWISVLVGNLFAAVTRSVYSDRFEMLAKQERLRWIVTEIPAAWQQQYTVTAYGVLAFFLSLATAAAFFLLGGTKFWRHSFRWIVGVQAATVLSFWVLSFTESLVLMVLCFAVTGFNAGFAFFTATYYSVSDAEHKHRNAAINEGAVGVGVCIGGLGFGQLAEVYGVTFPFRYALVLLPGIVLFEYGLIRWRRKRLGALREDDS